MRFIETGKQSKKKQKEINARNRVMVSFNTGTQIHKDTRHKSRAQEKVALRKMDY